MNQKIKVAFCDFPRNFNFEEDFYYKSIKKIKNIKVVSIEEKPEVIIFSIFGNMVFEKRFNKCKKIFICGENIYDFKLNSIFFIKKLILDKFNLSYKLISPLVNLKIFYINLFNPFKKQIQYLKKLNGNNYAITIFDIKNKNHYNNTYHHLIYSKKIEEILKRNKIEPKKFCAFIVSNPNSYERNMFYKELSKYKKVDSYGKLFNNSKSDLSRKDFMDNSKIFSEYKFVVCFENSNRKGYVTEKLINVMQSGSIPIYRGSSDIGKYFNDDSLITYENSKCSNKEMIKKILELDKNDSKFKKMLNKPYFKNNKIPEKIKKSDEKYNKFIKNIFK
jgi:hypothetical protein